MERPPVAKSKYFVYSMMSASVRYAAAIPATEPGGLPTPTEGIVIAGGTGVANKNLITPTGAMVTRVTAEQLEALRTDRVFQEHEKNGAISVREHEIDGEKAAVDMLDRDRSAPIVPEDFEAAGEKAPQVGAASSDDEGRKNNPRRA